MPKTYFNDAIVGNSSMLGCLTRAGELVRLYWPHPDQSQLFEGFITGVKLTGSHSSTRWLHESNWSHSQYYTPDTNILKTIAEDTSTNIRVEQTDFITVDNDMFVRRLKIKNNGDHDVTIKIMQYSSFVSNLTNLASILFDFTTDALIHFRSGIYAAVFADLEATSFQLGNNAYESALNDTMYGNDNIGMMKDGTAAWNVGTLEAGGVKEATIYVCIKRTLSEVKKEICNIRNLAYVELYNNTFDYWSSYIKSAKEVKTGNLQADELYKRSLLVFKLMCDKNTGGILAAPEIDEEFTRCGRYAYCWGRDAGFIASALDACGLTPLVDRFYKWAVKTQDNDGFWHQRYSLDGNLAPSWGLQIDETGTLVWGILQHYCFNNDKAFLERMWPSVEKAVNFMIGFIDQDTGLPGLSFDLWEERYGVHGYSSAAVYGGIMAGAEIARLLGKNKTNTTCWEAVGKKVLKAIDSSFWKDEGYFVRSIRTKLNPWGSEPSDSKVTLTINPKGYKRDFTLEDSTVESSLLGLCIPFGVYLPDDEKMRLTAARIEANLTTPAGGIKRYGTDGYIGGNPWIVTTLWLGLYYAEIKNYKKSLQLFDWAVKGVTSLGLLPEQVDKITGKPAWVIPLTWSHAMYVLLLLKLYDQGCFKQLPD